MSQWQPIESAPRDGTVVLLWGGRVDYYSDELKRSEDDDYFDETVGDDKIWNNPRPVTGWYIGKGCWAYCSYDSGTYGDFHNPTHWMPLPAAPE